MAKLDLNAFTRLAGAISDELPSRLLRDLNGGISILPGKKKDGKYFLMGEYIEDPILGRSIFIYYGSFREVLGDAPQGEWEEELRETIVHELRHHVESLAGVDDLSVEEEEELAAEEDGDGQAQ
ncbi:MAG: metallopeptidase family protein [Synergistaceae bacterium]|nr:metallopeptidase family protein [Synergistaceae bacterium]